MDNAQPKAEKAKKTRSSLCCAFGKKSKTPKSSPGKTHGEVKPVIGPKNNNDQMIKSSTKTITSNGKKRVELTETYQTPDGKTYELSKITESKE